MRKNARRKQALHTVADFCEAMENIAPTRFAQGWDNVGLIAGDLSSPLRRILLCIDLTPAVVDEAAAGKIDMIMAYHPPIFKPIRQLRMPSDDTDEAVFRCIRQGAAIYSTHTALDAASGGTNDVIASLCGIKHCEPLEYVDDPSTCQFKLVVFVPSAEVDAVADAMFSAGAGRIGDYAHCSYRSSGRGTFLGGESTSPTIGKRGKLEYVDEIRLETLVSDKALPAVLRAMIATHSYEEPAFDIYPLKPAPARGIGRVGALPKPVPLTTLSKRLKRLTGSSNVQIVGQPGRAVERAVIVVGAAGTLPFKARLGPGDVIITGEIRHHDALSIRRRNCSAIALGHWASERPTLPVLAQRLNVLLKGVDILVSEEDCDPFAAT